MKKTKIIILALLSFAISANAQNVFPTGSNTNAGIGTTSPTAKLHIKASNSMGPGCAYDFLPGLLIDYTNYQISSNCMGQIGSPSPITGTPSDMFLIRKYDPMGIPQYSTMLKVDAAGRIGLGMDLDPSKNHFGVQMGGNAHIKRSLQINNNLHINNGSLTVQQLYTLNGYRFAVNSGNSKLGGDVEIDGSNHIAGTLEVADNTNLGNNLSVVGESSLLGKVSIGNLKADGPYANYMLSVDGDIISKKLVVQISNWADYVFDEDYNLPSLESVNSYISKNNHLPEMPSELTIKKNGLEVGEMLKMQQQKIEELTLYLIKQDKALKNLQSKIKTLENK